MRNKLLLPGLIIVCVAFFLCLLPFQGANSEVEHGKIGLRFSVQGLDNVGVGMVNCGIGLKGWLADNVAVRGNFGFGFSDFTGESTNEDYTDYKDKERGISFGVGPEYHPLAGNRVSPYIGVGITFSTSTTEEEPSIHKTNPSPYDTKLEKWSSSGFGGGGLVGVEFFMGSNLSLSGEYEMGFCRATSKYKRELVGGQGVEQPKEQKSTTTCLGVSTSSLILTVYF